MNKQHRWMFYFHDASGEPNFVVRTIPVEGDVLYAPIEEADPKMNRKGFKVIVDAHDLESASRQVKTVMAEMTPVTEDQEDMS